MNFFGHAVAAHWVDPSPAFGYGAMLPDLISMVGGRRFECNDEQVARGVRFHHLTDRCFHEDPTFAELEASSRKELAELGVRKGPRRALSHVGIELLLDTVLARTPEHLAAYRAALAFGGATDCVKLLPAHEDSSLGVLARVLRERAAHLVPSDAESAVDRMARMLERRPALGFDESERGAVLRWTEGAIARVDGVAEPWIATLREAVCREFERASAA